MSTASLSKPGALVQARGREWVVLPESTDELLMLRPVGGLDEEVTGLLPAVEPVESATFRLPGREDLGDFASGRRTSTGPNAKASAAGSPAILSSAAAATSAATSQPTPRFPSAGIRRPRIRSVPPTAGSSTISSPSPTST